MEGDNSAKSISDSRKVSASWKTDQVCLVHFFVCFTFVMKTHLYVTFARVRGLHKPDAEGFMVLLKSPQIVHSNCFV